MELVEVSYGQNDIFFQFQKEDVEPHNFPSEDIQNLNIKFELIKIDKHDIYKEPPFLVSVKDMHFIDDLIAFSVTLDDLKDIENLQINVIKLTIFLINGDRLDIYVDKKYALSELNYQDSDYFEYLEEETIYKRKRKVSIRKTSSPRNKSSTKSRIINVDSSETPISRKSQKNIHKQLEPNCNIPMTESEYANWLKLKGDKSWETTMFMIREGFEKFKELEDEVKNLNKTIQEIALKSAGSSHQPIYLQSANNTSSPNQLNPPPSNGPPKRMSPPSVNTKYNLEDQTSHKVFRDKKNPNSMKYQIELMREMKDKFNGVSDVKEILKKVPEDELNRPRAKTDHLAFLEFKCVDSEKKRKNLVEKLKSLGYEKDTEVLAIEDLETEIKKLMEKKTD